MSGRLIKYDLLALGRILLPIQGSILGLSVLASIYFTFRMRSSLDYNRSNTSADDLLNGLAGLGIMLLGAVFIAGFLVTLFLIARHYYTNIYSDEGYLTMTLPATINQQIISKLISGFIWILINGLVMLLSLAILLFFGTATHGLINGSIAEGIGEVVDAITANSPLLFVVYPISAIIASLSQMFCIYTCISAGCAWAKKHRIALAVLLIFGVYIVTSIISSIANGVVGVLVGSGSSFDLLFSYMGAGMQPYFDYLLMTSLVGLVINIALIVAYYAFSHYALANRLNLE
jgi:hypothetical protein